MTGNIVWASVRRQDPFRQTGVLFSEDRTDGGKGETSLKNAINFMEFIPTRLTTTIQGRADVF